MVLPVAAGVFSALGLLFSNLEMNETAPVPCTSRRDAPLDEAEREYAALAERIAAVVGGPREDIRFARHADCRFAGQAYELTVPFDEAHNGEAGGEAGGRSGGGPRQWTRAEAPGPRPA